MYNPGSAALYEQWMGGITGHDVDGVKMPTQWENLKVLPFLPVQLHVLALLHVELCRTTERYSR